MVCQVEKRLDVTFKNPLLLVQALTHRSYLNEHPDHPTEHYERLEFLGDAIIDMVVTEVLYRSFPENEEGALTNQRAILVSGKNLGHLGEKLEFHEFVLLSKGQRRAIGFDPKVRLYICSCIFEAIIGALFLDQGLGACRMVIDHFIHAKMLSTIGGWTDHKSALQEEAQARWGITPIYKVLAETGPDHARSFRIGFYVGHFCVSVGEGSSKKEAQEAAAKTARETITQWEGPITEFAGQATSVTRRSGNRGRR